MPADTVPASRKLGRDDAEALAKKARTVVVAKGKKVETLDPRKEAKALADVVLGPTGNLRAPAIRTGKTWLVGFNEEAYTERFG